MELVLANPRGFCAGVERAVGAVEALIAATGAPVFVRHEIVHNHVVVDRLRALGARFVEATDEIPEGELAVLSAHGVPPSVLEEAGQRHLRVVDATCPLVTRVQLEVRRQAEAGRSVVVIGHRGHVEVAGLTGNYPENAGGAVTVIETADEADRVQVPDPARIAWVTQTTLAIGEVRRIVARLRARFPALADPRGETICYATQNRQDAVRALAARCGVIVVLGAPHSSNSNRMAEVARECGARALLIERPDELRPALFADDPVVGLTSSASAPETLVEDTLAWFRQHFPQAVVSALGKAEDVHFNLPHAIRQFTKESTGMDDSKAATRDTGTASAGIDDVLESAADLAATLRKNAESAGEFTGEQVARLVKVATDLRDRSLSEKLLASARKRPTIQIFRASAHAALDVGVDLAAVAVETGLDAVELLLRRREKQPG